MFFPDIFLAYRYFSWHVTTTCRLAEECEAIGRTLCACAHAYASSWVCRRYTQNIQMGTHSAKHCSVAQLEVKNSTGCHLSWSSQINWNDNQAKYFCRVCTLRFVSQVPGFLFVSPETTARCDFKATEGDSLLSDYLCSDSSSVKVFLTNTESASMLFLRFYILWP